MSFIVVMTIFFFLLTITLRKKFSYSERLKPSEAICFFIAMIILYAVLGSPLDLLGHIMFSIHMAQMALLYMVVTPLIIIGIPKWVWAHFVQLPIVRKVFLFFTRPILSVLLFSILFSLYHIPTVFDAIKLNEVLHSTNTLILFVFSLFLWWPLLNSLPGQYQISGLKKVGYIIASAILLTPACGMIIFANGPLYTTYSNGAMWLKSMSLCVPGDTLNSLSLSGPELFSHMPVVQDQQLGGVIMKIIQEIVDISVLVRVFFEWYRKDQADAEKLTRSLMIKDPAPID
jgi:putative membrane protein